LPALNAAIAATGDDRDPRIVVGGELVEYEAEFRIRGGMQRVHTLRRSMVTIVR
jgi:hypothetical protein